MEPEVWVPISIAIFSSFAAIFLGLRQVRVNNISQARIVWIQELRIYLAELVGKVSQVSFHIHRLIEILRQEDYDSTKYESLNNELWIHLDEMELLAFKVRLYLNVSEQSHNNLENLLVEYVEIALDFEKNKNSEDIIGEKSKEILSASRTVLKEAWEQAKQEGTIMDPEDIRKYDGKVH